MKSHRLWLGGILMAIGQLIIVGPSHAQNAGAAATLAKDCATEINKFCAEVSPGDDRIVACLIAYEDKASARCRLTAYLASGNLGTRLKQLQSMAKTCSSDIAQYCSNVRPGGGRIFDCIKKQSVHAYRRMSEGFGKSRSTLG